MAKIGLKKNKSLYYHYIAAPTPIPVKPASVIGVSTILLGPNLSYSPLVTLYAP